MSSSRETLLVLLLLCLPSALLTQRVFLRRPVFRSQRASNTEFIPYAQSQKTYYTRPEDFSIPSYRPASPSRPPFPLKDNFNPKAYEVPLPSPSPLSPTFSPPYHPQPVSNVQTYQPPAAYSPSQSPSSSTIPPSYNYNSDSSSTPSPPSDVPYRPVYPSAPEGPPPSRISEPSPPLPTFYHPPGGSGPVYEPPGRIPENYTQQLTSVHVNPAKVSGRVEADTDQVSFYSPEKSGRRGPVLVISNAAKGDAARNGYRPPPPPPQPVYEPPPPPPPRNPYEPLRYETPATEGPTTRDLFRPTPPPATLPPPTRSFIPSSSTPNFEKNRDNERPSPNPYDQESGYTLSPPPRAAPSPSPPAYPSYEPPGSFPPSVPPKIEVPDYQNPSPPPKTDFPYERAETTTSATAPTVTSSETPWTSSSFETTPSRETTSAPPQEESTPVTESVSEESTPPTQPTTTFSGPSSSTPSRFVPPQQFSRPTSESTRRPWTTPSPSTQPPSDTPRYPEDTEFPSLPPQSTPSPPEIPSQPPQETFATFPPSEETTPPGPTPPGFSPPPRLPPGEFPSRTPPRTPFDTTTFTPISYTTGVPFVPRNVSKKVPNRIRGKAHVLCLEKGIELRMQTLFPFTGQIHAKDKLRVPECSFSFHGEAVGKVFFPYKECGIPNSGNQSDQTQFHMQIIVTFEEEEGPSSLQSFIAQCQQQRVLYNKQTLPRRIEEALEELRLVPIGLEQKAPIPTVQMKVLREEDHPHYRDGSEEDVDEVDMGQPLKIEWKLIPETDAYGFHVRNCSVKDTISGIEHVVIDDRGCSTDQNIFGHPHYDTYHDVATAHFHAFKVPDLTRLAIHCQFLICTNIPSTTTNFSSCDSIPTPPFCPDLITSPTNSILSDADGQAVEKRSTADGVSTQGVHAEICLAEHCDPQRMSRVCISQLALSATTGLSASTLVLSAALHLVIRLKSRRRQ